MKIAIVLLIVLWSAPARFALSQQASSAPPDLNGTWTTADGTMVSVTQRGAAIEARSLVPNRQMATLFGWKSGDLVFLGMLVGGTITGKVAYRFPVKAGETCPGKAMIMVDLEMQVLGADQLMGKSRHRILGTDCSLSNGPWGALEFTRRSFDVKETASEINVRIHDGILFDLDRSDLKPDALAVLRELKQLVLDQQPFVRILIEGHTDSQGSDAHNMTLSLQRANAVSRWLVESGVPQRRLDAIGFGRSRPLLPNSTTANRARNRRVEIKVIKQTAALCGDQRCSGAAAGSPWADRGGGANAASGASHVSRASLTVWEVKECANEKVSAVRGGTGCITSASGTTRMEMSVTYHS